MFGLENRADLLYGGATNSLENVITLETTPHLLFDKFYLWLEPVEGQVRLDNTLLLLSQRTYWWSSGTHL